jgi:hypothetical protein
MIATILKQTINLLLGHTLRPTEDLLSATDRKKW